MKLYIIITLLSYVALCLLGELILKITGTNPKRRKLHSIIIGLFVLVMAFVRGYIKGANGLSGEELKRADTIIIIGMLIIFVVYYFIIPKVTKRQ